MKKHLVSVPSRATVRVYLRRSKGDAEQTHSLDVQRAGCERFVATLAVDADRVEYIDDDRAGDDFAGRVALQSLLKEARPGDIVVCRDQSRLGRDALETALAVRGLVRDRGATLFYYASGQRVEMKTAIDQAMAVIVGTGHQMELENIRSRVAEALRARVRSGRLAGGRCFGYRNIQNPDAEGRRKNTTAVIDETQAKVVRRVFEMYVSGRGLGAIAKTLNAERVPPPSAGKRGTGSWAPSAIRSMLQNERYAGVYVHGRIDRKRAGGKRLTVKADPSKVIRFEVPQWAIIEPEVWSAVQAMFSERAGQPFGGKPGAPAVYPLSGIARCAAYGGPIVICRTKAGATQASAYGCGWHQKRGDAVCMVKLREPRHVVEGAVFRHLLENVLTPDIIANITARVVELAREEASAPAGEVSVESLEAELATLRGEQKRVARLLAKLDDAPELEQEYQTRTGQIRQLETDIAAAKAAPRAVELAVEAIASSGGTDLREATEGARRRT